MSFLSKAALEAATVPSSTKHVHIAGFYSFGDGGHGDYKRVAAAPSHGLKIRSTDRFMPDGSTDATNGGWWELVFKGEVRILQAGAKADGATDDTAAIQAAADALGMNGGTVRFPNGIVKFASPLNFDDKRSLILQGCGGLSAGAGQSTTLLYTGTGSATAIRCGTSFGIWFIDMSIEYNQSGFTGSLIKYGHSATAADSAFGGLVRCFLIPSGVSPGTATLLNLDKTILMALYDCYFSGGKPSIQGQSVAGGSYSNSILVQDCTFNNHVGSAVSGVGGSWNFVNCTWHANSAGQGVSVTNTAVQPVQGCNFIGCVTTDVVASGGTQFTFVAGEGVAFQGGVYGGEQSNTVFLVCDNVKGISLDGVVMTFFAFGVAFSASGGACDGVSITGCRATASVNTPLFGASTIVAANLRIEGNTPAALNYSRRTTVAALPSAASYTGDYILVTNGRKVGEGSGAGTGTLAYSDGTAWRRVGDDTTVAA